MTPPLRKTQRPLPLPLLLLLLLALPDETRVARGDVVLAIQRTTTTTQAPPGLDVSTFPLSTTLGQVHGPSPLLPFVVQGLFKTSSLQGETRVVFSLMDGQDRGIELKMADQKLYFRVAAAHGTWISVSQQGTLDDNRQHSFLAVATAGRVQVRVDGLLGTSAAVAASGCEPGNDDVCFFGWQASANSRVIIGSNSYLDPATVFSGEILDIKMRRMVSGEEPQSTAADGMSGSSPTPAPSGGGSSDGTDAFFTVLIFILIIVVVSLIVAGTMIGCWLMKKSESSATSNYARPAAAAKEEAPQAPPAWWTNAKRLSGAGRASELVPASMASRAAVQELMNGTWRGVVTKDRTKHSPGTSVQHFEVVQVNRNENPKLWQDYALRRRAIAKEIGEQDLLNNVLTANGDITELGNTEPGCNEFLLFHGTKPSAVGNIIENDFLLKLAGSRRGTLYGHGCYFAESSSKADEYAEDDKDGIYRGLYAMLLCRVTLGRTLYTDEAFPDGAKLKSACSGPGARYHSVLGDREKARGTYREFIVYSVAQAYPEYVVIYRCAEATE